jgi:two-component system phosphate regulon response regulator OmpR
MILLLSSEPRVRAVIKDVLQRAGHVVFATGNLGTAVDALDDYKIELLITHPYVDSITGYDAAKYLREKNPHMGILIVTGFLADDRLQYPRLEGFEIFPPPYDAAPLVQKVAAVLKAVRQRPAQHKGTSGRR